MICSISIWRRRHDRALMFLLVRWFPVPTSAAQAEAVALAAVVVLAEAVALAAVVVLAEAVALAAVVVLAAVLAAALVV